MWDFQSSSFIVCGGSECLSVSADAFPFHCTCNLSSPPLLLEKELTAVQINQRDLINLATAHTSNWDRRQAINSANYLLLEGMGVGRGVVGLSHVMVPTCPPTLYLWTTAKLITTAAPSSPHFLHHDTTQQKRWQATATDCDWMITPEHNLILPSLQVPLHKQGLISCNLQPFSFKVAEVDTVTQGPPGTTGTKMEASFVVLPVLLSVEMNGTLSACSRNT